MEEKTVEETVETTEEVVEEEFVKVVGDTEEVYNEKEEEVE